MATWPFSSASSVSNTEHLTSIRKLLTINYMCLLLLLLLYLTAIWNYDSYTIKSISSNKNQHPASPISSFNCMLPVAGKLWCSSSPNTIALLDPNTLNLEVSFSLFLLLSWDYSSMLQCLFVFMLVASNHDRRRTLGSAAGHRRLQSLGCLGRRCEQFGHAALSRHQVHLPQRIQYPTMCRTKTCR